MKNTIYQNEYITNNKEVYNIIKNKGLDLKYKGVKDKMYQYDFIINGVSFNYFEGLGLDKMTSDNKPSKIINALWCVLQDADTINFYKSIDNFMSEFGYLDYTKALKVFKECKSTKQKLSRLFTSQELRVLRDNINL